LYLDASQGDHIIGQTENASVVGQRRPKTLKGEDLALARDYQDLQLLSSFMYGIHIKHARLLRAEAGLHSRKSNTCFNAREMLPHWLGFEVMTWASAKALKGGPEKCRSI
jgi:hypothetical protein